MLIWIHRYINSFFQTANSSNFDIRILIKTGRDNFLKPLQNIMKKYISLLSITSAFFMQSCERTESISNATEQIEQQNKVQSTKESSRIQNQNVLSEEEGHQNKETGDDDEPKRDKQHWRIVRDTIW